MALSLLETGHAAIKLPAILSDNMLLQQDALVNIWGTARPKEQIRVSSSWSKQAVETVADASGKWIIRLQTPKASAQAHELLLQGSNTIRIRNILIGEVWLCSGQSNMDFPVAKSTGWKTGILDEAKHMQDADYPAIRLFHVAQTLAPKGPLEDCEGTWMICNPENLKDFSAVAFFFGRKVYQQTKRPIGLIQTSWGGTPAESWTPMDVIKGDPIYADLIKEQQQKEASYPQDSVAYSLALQHYEQARQSGITSAKAPKKPADLNHNKVLSTLWNGMVNPLVNYRIKGVIWYQGESNAVRAAAYQSVFTNLIRSWRQQWKQANMPFYFVQIAPYGKQPPEIREAQLRTARTVRGTGMVVLTDAGDSTDIHPRNKQIPGERLANWALAKDYGVSTAYSGPVFKAQKVKKNVLELHFDFAEQGFQQADLKTFELAGKDGQYYPAQATIVGNKIVLASSQVPVPRYARYAWGNYSLGNLYNAAGLPASPFRTVFGK